MPGPARAIRTTLLLAFHACWWWLLLVWILAPDDPARLYRTGVLATIAVGVVLALLPPVRRLVRTHPTPLRVAHRLALATLLTVVGAEVGCRILTATIDSPLTAWSHDGAAEFVRHHRLAPHAEHFGSRCNSLGYVDAEFTLERDPTRRRIVVLGDSFVVGGVPYEQNFATLVETLLDAHTPTEVLNFGVPGAGPPEYLEIWNTEAARYAPDRVVVVLFVGNDFQIAEPRSLLHADALRSWTILRRLWRLLWHERTGQTGSVLRADPNEPTFSEADFRRIEAARVWICRTEPDATSERSIAAALAFVDRLHEAIGERLHVVVAPDEFQVDDALWHRVVGDAPLAYDRDLPQTRLKQHLATRGVPFLDLLPTLRAAHRDAPTYKVRDTHWNAHGNAAAARAIADWLAAPQRR